MYKNPKNIMQQHLKEQLSSDKETSHVIGELIKLSLLRNASKDEDLVVFAEIYKALGVENFTTLINLIDGKTLEFPSKEEFKELLITVLCYYYKEVEHKDWEDIKSIIGDPDLNSIKHGIRASALGSFLDELVNKGSHGQ